jgi:acyl-CoA dehydrogenase
MHVLVSPNRKRGSTRPASVRSLFIDDLRVPVEDRVGEEGEGFRYLLDGLNPERMLVAAEALGLGRAALRRAVKYGNEREVFGRPIGMNQGLHGGMGYAEEYHVARYFREARMLRIAPVSQEMVLNYLGSHVLGLPRSY